MSTSVASSTTLPQAQYRTNYHWKLCKIQNYFLASVGACLQWLPIQKHEAHQLWKFWRVRRILILAEFDRCVFVVSGSLEHPINQAAAHSHTQKILIGAGFGPLERRRCSMALGTGCPLATRSVIFPGRRTSPIWTTLSTHASAFTPLREAWQTVTAFSTSSPMFANQSAID